MEYGIIIVFAGILSGFLSEIGGAGSLVSLPILISLGVPPIVANGTNRIAVLSLYSSAYIHYELEKRERVHPNYIFKLAAPILVGVMMGAWFANSISNTATHWIVIAFSMGMIYFNSHVEINKNNTYRTEKISLTGREIVLLLGVGIYAGLIQSGMTYIFLYIFSNVIAIDYVTSKFLKYYFGMLVTPFALFVFMFFGNIDMHIGVLVFIGGAIGGWIGAVYLEKWSEKRDRMVIRVTIILSILYLILFMSRHFPEGISFI